MNKKKIINWIAELRIKIDRGVGVIYTFRQAMVFGAATQIILKLSILGAIMVTIAAYIGFYILGSLKIIVELFNRQAELSSSKYNPHLNKLSKLVK